MITNPILPIWLMAVICVVILAFTRKGVYNIIKQILLVVLIFVINLRPMVKSYDMKTKTVNVDVLFVVDNTISMLAEDMDDNGRRIDSVAQDVQYIMEKLPGARFSLITFCNEAQRLVPYTTDVDLVRRSVSSLNAIGEYYAKGTSFDVVVGKMKTALDNDSENVQVVFFLSDGEDNSGENTSFKELKEYIDLGAVLGYGTEAGGKMKVHAYSSDSDWEYLEYYNDDYDRVTAVSHLDENNLEDIAKEMGVDYIHMTKSNKVDNVIEDALSMATAYTDTKGEGTGYDDIYFWFMIPLIIILVVDAFRIKKKL